MENTATRQGFARGSGSSTREQVAVIGPEQVKHVVFLELSGIGDRASTAAKDGCTRRWAVDSRETAHSAGCILERFFIER